MGFKLKKLVKKAVSSVAKPVAVVAPKAIAKPIEKATDKVANEAARAVSTQNLTKVAAVAATVATGGAAAPALAVMAAQEAAKKGVIGGDLAKAVNKAAPVVSAIATGGISATATALAAAEVAKRVPILATASPLLSAATSGNIVRAIQDAAVKKVETLAPSGLREVVRTGFTAPSIATLAATTALDKVGAVSAPLALPLARVASLTSAAAPLIPERIAPAAASAADALMWGSLAKDAPQAPSPLPPLVSVAQAPVISAPPPPAESAAGTASAAVRALLSLAAPPLVAAKTPQALADAAASAAPTEAPEWAKPAALILGAATLAAALG